MSSSVLSPFHEHSMFGCVMDPLPHNSRHVSFVVCSRCRLELFARDVGHCVLEPVGPKCHRLVGWWRSLMHKEWARHLCWSCPVLQTTPSQTEVSIVHHNLTTFRRGVCRSRAPRECLGKLLPGILSQDLAHCPAKVLQPIRHGFHPIFR